MTKNGTILYKNGEKQTINTSLRYYFNAKEKKYLGVQLNEGTEDMFDCYLKANKNTATPKADSVVLPLGNKCLAFCGTDTPILYVNGSENKLYESSDGFKDRSNSLQIKKALGPEFDGRILGYEIFTDGAVYLVITGENLNTTDRKSLIQTFDKIISFDSKHRFVFNNCNYNDLINYVLRKDDRRVKFRKVLQEIKKYPKEKNKENLLFAIKTWWLTH